MVTSDRQFDGTGNDEEQNMMNATEREVIVVGAGPAGAMTMM